MTTQRRTLLLAAAAGAFAGPRLAAAQGSFPERPMRIIVPFPPGGPVDLLARLLAERLTARWPHPVLVENRPGGGGGTVGTSLVARSTPDGSTIGMVISAHAINAATRSNLPYDTLRDFAYITQVARAHLVLVANPSLPVRSIGDVVELARRTEGGMMLASPGVGTLMNMTGHLLAATTGARLNDVPYTGSAPALTDLMQGRVPLMFDIWHSVRPHVEAGRLRVIAAASPTPIPGAEQIPLISATLPGFAVTSPFGLVAPAATPRPVVERIAAEVRAVITEPAMTARLLELGMEPVGSSPADYAAFVESEIERWRRIVRERGIQIVE